MAKDFFEELGEAITKQQEKSADAQRFCTELRS